ncbi:Clavaminate synthase-like protein [Daldinia caldariorum]|uniref:Clavaminate synthase-like protein n=1 Tax=Daldinia caldariorum TaxID=326644 RepID=UPI0020081F78|nr:Clavaminate synthase-like protein [Daldinia caldariorum]KAI1469800.1 Clavaminate synthase-like protein [Daldinia caldariorum]
MLRRLLNSKGFQIRSGGTSSSPGTCQAIANRVNERSISLSCKHQVGFQVTTSQSRQCSTAARGYIPSPRSRPSSCRTRIGLKRGFASQATPHENPWIKMKDESTIQFGDPDKIPLILDRHWLRDSCQCNLCVNPDSGQKNFSTCDVPTYLPIKEIHPTEEGGLDVVWEMDFLSSGDHVSHYTAAQVNSTQPEYALPGMTLWDTRRFEKDRLVIDYKDWMAGERGFLSGLHRLHTHGLIFIRNVPSSEESVISIATKFGNLQETFYGRTWDVRSKPRAENVAYTNEFLGLHQDLMYMKDPPRLQLLHCLENTCEGGESMFSDGSRAAHLMELGPRKQFEHLCNRNIKYQYKKNGHHYQQSRPVIEQSRGQLLVSWSPPFQASNQRIAKTRPGHENYRKWLQAATVFRHLLEDKQWMYQHRMEPGECVIFDNQRVLHGRRQFDTSSGSRWLKGAYIGDEVFRSKLVNLNKELLALGVGNELAFLYQASLINYTYKIWNQDETLNRMKQLGADTAMRGYTDENGFTIWYS